MEALKPVLAQKFWILLGLAMIMTLTGWWMSTAEMLKKIKVRREEIKKAFDSIPKGKIPRDSWAGELNALNEQQKKSIASTRAKLWEKQLAKMMEWPRDVQPRNGYLGTFSNESKNEYKETYFEEEVTKVWKQLRPFEPDGTGIVDYPIENMYELLRRYPGTKAALPTDEEMWNIKEDLLLLEALFQSIAAVNGGFDVPRSVDMIHQIDVLELRGGNASKAKPVPPGAASNAVGGGAPGGPAAMATYSAEFNPREEFGDDGSVAPVRTNTQTGADRMAGPRRAMSLGAGDFDEKKSVPGSAPAAAKGKPVERYVSKVGDSHKTRGFYLVVEMDHLKIPQLIAELTANDRSVWPVEILRVQMSRRHEDTIAIGNAGAAVPVAPPGQRRPPRIEDIAGFPGGQVGNQPGQGDVSDQLMLAQASLAKALSNPTIAQVAICGVFTLYQKTVVEDAPKTPAAPTTTPAVPATAPAATAAPVAVSSAPADTASPIAQGESETTADSASASTESDASTEAKNESPPATDEPTTDMPAESDSPPEPNAAADTNPESDTAKPSRDEK